MYLGILCHISSPHSKSYNFLPEINIGQYYLEIANGWHCKRSTGRCQRPFRTHREQSFRFQIIWNVINRRRRRWLVPTISPVSIASSSPSSFAHKFKAPISIHPSQVDTLWQPRSIRSTSTCIRTWGRHQDESTLSKLETTPIYMWVTLRKCDIAFDIVRLLDGPFGFRMFLYHQISGWLRWDTEKQIACRPWHGTALLVVPDENSNGTCKLLRSFLHTWQICIAF